MFTYLKKILKTIPYLVKDIEQAAEDDKITFEERKRIAMRECKRLFDTFGVSWNFLTRWICSYLIDQAAKRLPSRDITLPISYLDYRG